MKFISLSASALLLVLTSCSSQFSTEEYLQRGANYMDKKEWKSAIIEYKNGIKQSPKNAQARLLLGKAYLQTYSSDAAIKEFEKAIALGINKNEVLVYMGKAFAQSNKDSEIISDIVLNNGLNTETQVTILALRAGAFMRKKELKNALNELEKAKSLDINNTDVRLMWAQFEALNGNVGEQIKWLKPLLGLNIADAWSQMGIIEQFRLNLDKSEAAFTNAIDIRKLIHKDYLSRALVRISLKKYDEAMADLELIKKTGLSTPLITHSEGVIAFYKKDLDGAQRKMDEVLGRYVNYPPSLFVLGLIHSQKKNYESAINSLRQYLKTNPDNLQAKMILATSLLQSNKLSLAIIELEKIKRIEPDNANVLSNLGRAYVRNGQLAKGIALFEKTVKTNPKQAMAQFQLGSALIRDKNTLKKGQQALIKALDIDSELVQANVTLYLSYMQSKEFNKAGDIAQKMIDAKPNEPLAYNLLAHSYLSNGENDKAIKLFNSTLKQFPADPLTSGNIARMKLHNNQLEDAKSLYLDVLKKHPSELRTLISLAVIESKLGNDGAIMDYLIKAVASNPESLSPKLILGTEYLKRNKFREAFNVLKEVSEVDKNKIEVQIINAKAKMGLKEYDYALVLLKKLVAKHPDSASSYFLLGQNYGYLKKKNKMKIAFEQVLRIKPDHFSASLILTRLALLNRDYKEFEARINLMIKVYPDNADVKFLHAKLRSKDKDYRSAISTLEGLLKETPHPEIIIDLAKNKWVSGDKEGAITGLELWLNKNPEDKKALMLLAQFYINQNRTVEANATYAKVDKLIPNNAIVLNNMAWLYRESNVKQGIKLAKKALSLEPNSPFIKDTLAMLLLGDNNASEALVYSKQAAAAQPNFIEIQMNYAKILIAVGDKKMAKNILKNIDSKAKSFDQRQQIRTLLNSL